MGWPVRRSVTPSVGDVDGFSVRVSEEPDDPTWDEFLERTAAGEYEQSSGWGRARAYVGWRPIRAVVSENGRVVAGVQMVTRSLPFGRDIGLVRKGPVVSDDRPELVRLVIDQMMALGRARKVLYLVAEPPRGCEWMRDDLCRSGLRESALDILKTQEVATIVVDLEPDVDALFAGLSRTFRQHVRTASKGGIIVRRGSAADLPIFNRLKDAHSARLGYDRRDEGYYAELWDALASCGHIGLTIAEYQGEPVSALLAIGFGDTSSHMERPWSGEHGELRPNNLLEWEVLKEAKAAGYRFADLGAIERPVVEALLSGNKDALGPKYGASLYKLKFGGRLVVDPPFFDYVYDPVLRLAYRGMPRRVLESKWMNAVMERFKATGS